MTSYSDDLEEALQENLKLRSELAVEVAGAKAETPRVGVVHRMGRVLNCGRLVLARNIAKLPTLLPRNGKKE